MSRIDGGLSGLFRQYLPEVDWVRIESGGTGLGIPDTNYAFDGREGWIELKAVKTGFKVKMRPEQVGWIERRMRHGGSVLIAVRGDNEFWLFDGRFARQLLLDGLRIGDRATVHCVGLPARWDWAKIRTLL